MFFYILVKACIRHGNRLWIQIPSCHFFFVSLENKKKMIYFNIESNIAVWQGEKPVIVSRWKNLYKRFPQIFFAFERTQMPLSNTDVIDKCRINCYLSFRSSVNIQLIFKNKNSRHHYSVIKAVSPVFYDFPLSVICICTFRHRK